MTALGADVGTAHITVRPSLRGWDRNMKQQLRKELGDGFKVPVRPDTDGVERSGRRAGDEFAGGFDRMVRKRIQASLAALPKAEIGVASNEAEQRLKDIRGELDGLAKKRIGVDVDSGAALARVRELQVQLEQLSAESADINVKADTILASTQLAAVHRQVDALAADDVTIDVNAQPAASGLSSLSGIAGLLTSKIAILAAVGITLIPVVAVIASLGATLLATLTAAGGGVGALLAGLLGNILPVVKAQSELKQKQEQAASAAQSYAAAQQQVRSAAQGVATAEISAARAVSDAQRAIADARRNAARSIEAAEDQVRAAQERRRDAQDDLTSAIEAARRKLADYQSQLRSAALDESGAALAVTQAQERLNEVLSDPTSTQLQIDLARQAMKESQFSYDEAQKRRKDLREQAAKDRAAGVSGDQGVVDAKEQLADANNELVRAETSLAQARADGARAVADAERNLARARADGARAVAAARQQLVQARAAEAAAAVKNAEAQAEVADRLAKLSGPAAGFVKTLDRAKAAWRQFVKAVAPDSFRLANRGLRLFTKLLPSLVPLARRSSRAVSTLLGDFEKFANGKEGRGFIRWLTRTAPRAIVTIGRSFGNILIGVGGLIGALTQTDTGFLSLTRRFADFGRNAGENSTVRGFFEYAKKNAPIVGDMIKALAGSFSLWMQFLAPFGSLAVRVIGIVYKAWAPVLRFMIARNRLVWDVVQTVWKQGVLPVFRAVAWYVTRVLGPTISWLWTKIFRPVFRAIGDVVQGIWRRFVLPVFQAIDYQARNVVAPALSWLGDKFKVVWRDVIKPILVAFRDFVRDDLVPAVRRGLEKIGGFWDGLKKAAGTPVKFVVDTVYNNGLRKVINAIPGVKNVDPVDTSGWPTFAHGGWTGPGSKYQPAGVVHADEFVVTKEGRRLAEHLFPGLLDAFNRRATLRGYANGGRVWPLPGARASTYAGHDGVDLNVGAGDDDLGMMFYAVAPGKVSYAGYGRGYGNAVFVQGPYGELVYGHSLDGSIVVRAGQTVAAGAPLARVGSTGNSSAPHLHFGFPGGTYEQALAFLAGASNGKPVAPGGGDGGIGAAVSAVKDFASTVPDYLKKLGDMGPWGGLLKTGLGSLSKDFMSWAGSKLGIPNPLKLLGSLVSGAGSLIGKVFDRGGLATGTGLLGKGTIAPERVLSPAQTAAYERQVATLEGWDRTTRALTRTGGGAGTRLDVTRFRIVDWDKGLAELEYLMTDVAEDVLARHTDHTDRLDGMDVGATG